MALISKPDYTYIWASGGAIVEPSDVKKQLGWIAEVPPHQWENWAQNRQDQFNAHVNQRGIAEWDGLSEYEAAGLSYVQGTDGIVYKSVAASGPSTTVQDPTTDVADTYWKIAFANNTLATESIAGIAPLATTAEAEAGVNDQDIMTPLKTAQAIAALAGDSLNTIRINVASASTVNLTSSAPNTNHINITGTTTITAFTVASGECYFVRFNASLTLTNNASIVTQSGSNIETMAGDTCIIRATAANVMEVLCYVRATQQQVIHVRDQKAAGTNGGTFTSGAWRTRDLNTTLTNTITGASLATNQVTLPAGVYEVMASAPSVDTNGHQARVYNITGAATLINGTTAFNSGAGTSAASLVFGRFTLTATSLVELQHACQTTAVTTGFGVGNTLGGQKTTEVYGDLFIRKVV